MKHITAYVRLAPVSRIGIAIALKGKSFRPLSRPVVLGVFFINALFFLLDHRFEYDYKSKKKRRMDSTSYPPVVIPEWVWNDKNNLHNIRRFFMQAEMLDSTVSCTPSTLNFACDVDGVHTELAIPSSAWDVENETVWLTQVQLSELYKVNVPAVSKQIQNVFEDEELQEDSVISILEITAADGKSYRTKHYNLEMLIALGYRIRSKVATKFRQWATQHLKELMTKGRTEIEPQPEMSDEEIMSRALEIAHRTLALREERIKALEAERDEAIRTKAMIGSRREATAMATASAKSKECKRLTIENEELKDAVGRGTNWCTVSMMKSEWKREFGHEPDWRQLKKFSADFPTDMQPVKDVEEKVVLHNGGEKVSKVYRYHREAWTIYRQYEETIRATDTETKNA